MSRESILGAAVELAMLHHYRRITRRQIAHKAKVANGTVSYHFRSMAGMRQAIMHEAIRLKLAVIVAQGLAEGSKAAKNAPQSLKDAAAKIIAS